MIIKETWNMDKKRNSPGLLRNLSGGQAGFSMIGMVISVVIIALLSYMLLKMYFGGSPGDAQTAQIKEETGGYPGMVQRADERTKQFNKEAQDRINQLDNIE